MGNKLRDKVSMNAYEKFGNTSIGYFDMVLRRHCSVRCYFEFINDLVIIHLLIPHIGGFHCHAIKNKIETIQRQKLSISDIIDDK